MSPRKLRLPGRDKMAIRTAAGAAVGVLAVALVAAILALYPNGSTTRLAALEEQPLQESVREGVGPGDTYIRTERVYRRYGPVAPAVMEDGNLGPETQLRTVASEFDNEGCISRVVATQTTEDGVVISSTSFAPGDGTAGGEATAGMCLNEFRQKRQQKVNQVAAYPGARVASKTDEMIEVIAPGFREPATVALGAASADEHTFPYTGDLEVVGTTIHFYIRTKTMQLVAYESRAALADGSDVVLERFELVDEEIRRGGES